MLNFIDIDGAFTVELKKCSAYIESDNSLVLIECGESIFE